MVGERGVERDFQSQDPKARILRSLVQIAGPQPPNPLGARVVAHTEDPAKLSRRATSSSRPHVEAVLLLATIAQRFRLSPVPGQREMALDSEGRQQFSYG